MSVEITWARTRAANGCLEHIGAIRGATVCRVYKFSRFVLLERIDGVRIAGHFRTIAEAKAHAHRVANMDYPFATLTELDVIRAALPVELTDEETETAEAAKTEAEFNARQGSLI